MVARDQTLSSTQIPTDWDCVVIGAGPAGTIAALRMARAGYATLLVEKKRFPRFKVCGGCLNGRGVSILKSLGLEETLHDVAGTTLRRFSLFSRGSATTIPIPDGISVDRRTFDQALAEAAIDAGVTMIQGVDARVVPDVNQDDMHGVLLKETPTSPVESATGREPDVATPTTARKISTRAVIAADGLGHPSLKDVPVFQSVTFDRSRVGLGGTVDRSDWQLDADTIHMAVANAGYVGVVQLPGGRFNIAAAVDPQYLRSQKSPGDTLHGLFTESGFPISKHLADQLSGICWTGTPQLTRRTSPLAWRRIFLVGDAAGYVEPFTGEGMAWALAGGAGVADCTRQAIESDATEAVTQWQATWSELVLRHQKTCRNIKWLLRHPLAMRLTMSTITHFPAITRPIVARMNETHRAEFTSAHTAGCVNRFS